jgi:hypothetical protein
LTIIPAGAAVGFVLTAKKKKSPLKQAPHFLQLATQILNLANQITHLTLILASR